jgi:glyoxylase-like metal-dependent hydrolase (beta-lactamase superfamily II)
MFEPSLSRRRFLASGAAAVAGASILTGSDIPGAEAKAPLLKTQAPYFYRFGLGSAQVSVVSDGPLPLGDPGGAFLGATKEEIAKMLSDNYLPTDNLVLEQNAPVINIGGKLVLFDTGMGIQKTFGPTTGRLIKSLGEAGIRPNQIDALIITHAHIDHIGGMVDARGRKLFAKAQVYMPQADFDFWTDEKKLSDPSDTIKLFVKVARDNLLPYREQIKFVKYGEEVIPGVQAIAAPGHTVGHTVYMITSDGKSMCFIGDLAHHQVILVERPKLEFAYDTDPKLAVQSRIKVLDMLAARKIPLMAYHFPWPGLGYVSKQGEGFHYHPAAMEIVQVPPKKV